MRDEYLWDKGGVADPEVVELEELLGRYRHRGAPPELGRRRPRTRAILLVAASILAAVSGALWLSRPSASSPVYMLEVLAGSPQIGGESRAGGALAPGEALTTDAASRALVRVGDIGTVELEPGCRLAVREAGDVPGSAGADYLLYLERGGIRAEIFAEPRAFQVGTPSGLAVDLGCVYEARVEDDGTTLLSVESGLVAFETPARRVVVPQGAVTRSHPVHGPGTPVWEDASAEYRLAAQRLDERTGDPSANLEVLLSTVDERDSLTLWHLLDLDDVRHREQVYDRLAAIAPPPSGVKKERVLEGDEDMRKRWRRTLSWYWGKKKG